MSCDIYPSDDGQYIIMRVEGNITRLASLEWTVQAHALGKTLNIDRYLMDLRQSRNLESNAEAYRLVHSDIPRLENFNTFAKVAILVAPGDESHNFIEVTAQGAGLDVTIFNNLDLALRHLAD